MRACAPFPFTFVSLIKSAAATLTGGSRRGVSAHGDRQGMAAATIFLPPPVPLSTFSFFSSPPFPPKKVQDKVSHGTQLENMSGLSPKKIRVLLRGAVSCATTEARSVADFCGMNSVEKRKPFADFGPTTRNRPGGSARWDHPAAAAQGRRWWRSSAPASGCADGVQSPTHLAAGGES